MKYGIIAATSGWRSYGYCCTSGIMSYINWFTFSSRSISVSGTVKHEVRPRKIGYKYGVCFPVVVEI